MSHPIPDGLRAHLAALPLAIWASDYKPWVSADDRALQKRFEVRFSPVESAFVACVRVGDGRRALAVSHWSLRCGRTNDYGWVLARKRAELGQEGEELRSGWKRKELAPGGVRNPEAVQRDAGAGDYNDVTLQAVSSGVSRDYDAVMFGPDDAAMLELDRGEANAEALHVLPNESYRIFWCYDKAIFEQFLAAFDADRTAALARFEVPHYIVQPFRDRSSAAHLHELSEVERGFVARQLSSAEEGYHGGAPTLDAMQAAVFDGTPRVLRTLYLCEWLHEWCLHLVRDDPHWCYLHALRSVIATTVSGAAIPDLAARMPKGEKGMRARQMREYLYRLAEAGEDSRAIATALIDIAGESRVHGHWVDLAKGFAQKHGIQHPALIGRSPSEIVAQDAPLGAGTAMPASGVVTRAEPLPMRDYYFAEDERAALVAYFDMYVLGFRRRGDAEALDAHWAHIQRVLGWIQARCAARLESSSHVSLMRSLAMHVPRSRLEYRCDLADRYHHLCAATGFQFWQRSTHELETQSAWDALKPFVVWMSEGTGLLEKLFEGFLKRYLPAYRGLLKDSAEQAVQYLYRYHLTLSNKGIAQSLPRTHVIVRLEPDASSGRALAKVLRGSRATALMELEVLTEVATAPEREPHAPLGASDGSTRFKRYQRAMRQGRVRTFTAIESSVRVADEDSEALAGFPKALAAASALLDTSMALSALVGELKKKELQEISANVYLDVAQESFAAVEPISELLAPMFARAGSRGSGAARALTVGTALSGASLALESVRHLATGGATLLTFYSPERANTDLARYLGEKRGLPAMLETTKGLVQVALGLTGGTGVVVGTQLTVATIPIATWLAVGLVAVSMLDVLIYLDTGGPSPLQAFLDRVRQARAAQFHFEGERIVRPDEAPPADAEKDVKRGASASLLARRLATVHHVMAAGSS